LGFHAACALAASACIYYAREQGSLLGLFGGEIALGFVSSFYFMGFHELIHNTAFKTKWLNKVISHVVGFFIFRGAAWFWSFHWLHHRYTQDPEKDPELSGGSSDLMDPSKSVPAYLRFLTGWPFGFERVGGMTKMALGTRIDPWVAASGMEKTVRIEATIHVLFYALFAAGAVCDARVREVVVFYWLLPHALGAGHLRFYQFAEHRACETGVITDLDAWGSARTTATWWFYRRLAWNMPFHIEHHAWPAVPFHLLPAVHDRIKASQPPSRCLISGDNGYTGIHRDFISRVWNREPTSLEPLEPSKETASNAVSPQCDVATLAAAAGRVTMDELAQHKTKDDCWVVIDGMVFNVTSFLSIHPGGEMVLANKAGQDATKMFKMIHPEFTLERHLPQECIVGIIVSAASGLEEPLMGKP